MVDIDPARKVNLIEGCEVNDIFRSLHIIPDGMGGNVVHWEETVREIAWLCEKIRDERWVLMRETVMVLTLPTGSREEIQRINVFAPFDLLALR